MTQIDSQLTIDHFISKGVSCRVFSGHDKKLGMVAVKIPSPKPNHQMLLHNEIQILKTIQTAPSPFLCIMLRHGRRFMVMEHLGTRDLRKATQDCDLLSKCRYLCHVASGILHLHDHHVIHHDIKPSNIMIQENERAKIIDFGLSCTIGDEVALPYNAKPPGSPFYMGPEMLAPLYLKKEWHSKGSLLCDIYAFSITAWETLVGQSAWAFTNPKQFAEAVIAGDRPRQTDIFGSTPTMQRMWKLLEECWIEQEATRLPAIDLVSRMLELQEAFEGENKMA